MQLDKFYIPKSLDDPAVFCYCTMGEIAIFGLCTMFGLFLKSFGIGLFVGMLIILGVKKIKSHIGAEEISLLLHWNLPHSMYGFAHLPASHKRRYIG